MDFLRIRMTHTRIKTHASLGRGKLRPFGGRYVSKALKSSKLILK